MKMKRTNFRAGTLGNLPWSGGRAVALIVMTLALVGTPCTGYAQAPGLTARDIQKLLGASVSEEVILAQVRQSGKPISLSTDELIALKNLGASDKLIAGILTAAPSTTSTASLHEARPELGVYARKDQAWVEIAIEVVNFKSSSIFKAYAGGMDLNGNIVGASSKTTLKTPIEILLITPEGVNASEYQLVRMRQKGNSREFRVFHEGLMGGKSGLDKDAVLFDAKKTGAGRFEIQLPSSVVAGEYAFVPPTTQGNGGFGGASGAAGKAYTFHVLE